MPKSIEWLQVNVYHPMVERIKELNAGGVQITRASNPNKKCALEIVAEEYDYGYWHTFKIYYFIYDESLVKKLLAKAKGKTG